jgi:hypothetical protein
VARADKKEINSLIILVTRALWLERNNMIFDKFTSMPREVCRKIRAEFELWKMVKLCGKVGDITYFTFSSSSFSFCYCGLRFVRMCRLFSLVTLQLFLP